MLYRENVYGEEIPTRPIIKPIEEFLDSHVVIDSKLEPVRDRRISRRINPLFDEGLKIDFILGFLNHRITNRRILKESIRRRNEEI